VQRVGHADEIEWRGDAVRAALHRRSGHFEAAVRLLEVEAVEAAVDVLGPAG